MVFSSHVKLQNSWNNTLYVVQVNKKFCELKGGNIGIVEKAQETRFGIIVSEV